MVYCECLCSSAEKIKRKRVDDVKSFSITHIGMRRSMNQDFFYASEQPVGNLPNLFIVADGMGGHNAGEYASKHTVFTMVKTAQDTAKVQPAAILEDAIREANRALLAQAALDRSMLGMGTTAVAAVICGGRLYAANVGDSRLYILNGGLRQITRDHSFVEEMVRRGELKREDAKNHPDKNLITRAVGAVREIEVDFFEEELHPGDIILLCSDGLTNMMEEDEIQAMVKGQADVQCAAEELVCAANQNGGKDNITVIVIDPFGGAES